MEGVIARSTELWPLFGQVGQESKSRFHRSMWQCDSRSDKPSEGTARHLSPLDPLTLLSKREFFCEHLLIGVLNSAFNH
jgi:hypothetical protein